MRTVDRYVLRVLAGRRRAPGGATTLPGAVLDLAPRADGLATELVGRGFRVSTLALHDGSLDSLAERVVELPGSWDAIACRGVLGVVDDWPELVGRLAARLRPGGVLIYSVDHAGMTWLRQLAGGVRRWLGLAGSGPAPARSLPAPDLVATLRRTGLSPRHLVAFGDRRAGRRTTGYLGYSVKPGLAPVSAAGTAARRATRLAPAMRWDFTGTGERWLQSRPAATR
jgi:SAM-dependent methyltransferase